MSSGLLTTVGFVAMTGLLMVWHLRRSAGTHAKRCNRCGAELPPGAARCAQCDVPVQIFEVASAAVASPAPAVDPAGGEAQHAVVRADVCVGCGCCVPVCPEPGAIRLEGKLAVVRKELCKGHGKCVEACPVGGIVLATGDSVHRVEVPDTRADFQTNVPGIFIAGELGGRGLIKNAINEGRVAAENVARELAGRTTLQQPGVLDLAIVGSGPAGLSAALAAKRTGLSFALIEQGTLADTIRKYPRHKLLLAEPLTVPLYGELWVADASKETLIKIWEAMIEEQKLTVRTGCRVEEIERRPGFLCARGPGFEVRARRVILAMGRRGTPRRLGVPGEEAEKVVYDVAEMEEFRGRHVLVVGGGDSALETAIGLANQRGTEVTLSHRRATFERAKERNRAKLEAAEQAGKVRVLRESAVKRITPTEVCLDVGGRETALRNDDVIVRIGGESPAGFLERTGIRMVTKEIRLEEAKAGVGG